MNTKFVELICNICMIKVHVKNYSCPSFKNSPVLGSTFICNYVRNTFYVRLSFEYCVWFFFFGFCIDEFIYKYNNTLLILISYYCFYFRMCLCYYIAWQRAFMYTTVPHYELPSDKASLIKFVFFFYLLLLLILLSTWKTIYNKRS